MKMKKILTGSALSLALLVSAAPAFATAASATSNTVSVEKEQKVITPQAYLKRVPLTGYPSRWSIPNKTVFMGVTLYLKEARQESDGTWTGIFEGWIND